MVNWFCVHAELAEAAHSRVGETESTVDTTESSQNECRRRNALD